MLVLETLERVHGRTREIPRFDPMEELVSCILSQHSADANTFPAFTRLLERYPSWGEVEAAGWEEVAEVVRKAGLANQKAKAIVACLGRIRVEFGGYTLEPLRARALDDALTWLESLPGVGPKTAAIVMGFSFGQPAIPVDTHVYRVCQRLGLIGSETDERAAHRELRRMIPPEAAFRFHTTFIQHGRKVCRAPIPDCKVCPVADLCVWRRRVGPDKARAAAARKRSSARVRGAA